MSTTEFEDCVPCGLHTPKRTSYFDGKLLVARDFIAEQAYHIGKRQMLNQGLHGMGTVCGLKVIEHPAIDCRRDHMVLEPGLALDCCGRELIAERRTLIPFAQMIADDADLAARLDGTRDLLVGLVRADEAAELAPVILPDCTDDAAAIRPGRVCEGVAIRLFAPDAAPASVETGVLRPELRWRHSIALSGQNPAALGVDADDGHLFVAAEGGEPGRTYVFREENTDLVTSLTGGLRTFGMAVSQVGENPYLFVAGDGFAAGDGVAAYSLDDIRSAPDPVGVIPTDGPSRVVVSPRTGALFVLELATGRLRGWSAETITDWLGTTGGPPAGDPPGAHVLDLGGAFLGPDDVALTGISMIDISADGRFLLVLDTAEGAGTPVRIVEVARLLADDLSPDDTARTLDSDADGRVVAAVWSLDGAFIHAVFETADGGSRFLRLQPADDGERLAQAGRGAVWPARANDIAVGPQERFVYVLQTDASAATPTQVAVLEMRQTQEVGDSASEDAVLSVLPLAGVGRNLHLDQRGSALYVSVDDEDAAATPDRGLVAIVEVGEADCGAAFAAALDGCPTCDGAHGDAVILAHLPGYVWAEAQADRPLVEEPGTGSAGAVHIDNARYRQFVPSAVTLKRVIDCILEQGVAEGPPGPRGEPGDIGPEGPQGPDGGTRRAAGTARGAGTEGATRPARPAGRGSGSDPHRGAQLAA